MTWVVNGVASMAIGSCENVPDGLSVYVDVFDYIDLINYLIGNSEIVHGKQPVIGR